ncbi:MAG: hypothetical protein AAB971_00335 [Patescibacteria group bacterium]
MKGVRQSFGYTVVELMIVLAVSGVMFIIAANFISGKQGKTSFIQGSNEMVSRIQGVIEQVTDGQYTDIPMSCTSNGSSLSITGAVKAQGTNPQCVFMGKIMHFSVASNRNKYEVFSLAGTRLKSDGTPAINFTDSRLTAVYFPSVVPPINLTSQFTTPQNLDITDMKAVAADTGVVFPGSYGVGFVQGMGTAGLDINGDADGSYKSGAQTISMVYLPVMANRNEADAANSINAGLVNKAKSVCIAVSDGTRGALINIGTDEGSQISVEIKQLGEVSGTVTCP